MYYYDVMILICIFLKFDSSFSTSTGSHCIVCKNCIQKIYNTKGPKCISNFPHHYQILKKKKNTHQSKFSPTWTNTACFIIDFNFALNLFTIMS